MIETSVLREMEPSNNLFCVGQPDRELEFLPDSLFFKILHLCKTCFFIGIGNVKSYEKKVDIVMHITHMVR